MEGGRDKRLNELDDAAADDDGREAWVSAILILDSSPLPWTLQRPAKTTLSSCCSEHTKSDRLGVYFVLPHRGVRCSLAKS